MKVIIVLASFVAVASAGHLQWGATPWAADQVGQSTQFRSEDDYGNYAFGYDEVHASGGSSRREEETGGIRRGSYSLSDADGRRRIVNFIADASGFHADVQTNEPGVEAKDPADVTINKAAETVVAAPAPIVQAQVIAAPAPAQVWTAPAPAVKTTYAAPAPIVQHHQVLAAPVKTWAAAPAVRATYVAPAPAVKTTYVAPAPVVQAPIVQAPVYEQQVIEAPTPRAFSYSFGSTHAAPAVTYAAAAPARVQVVAAPAPVKTQWIQQAPIVQEPIFQQRLAY